jgi:hypothetical protein
MWCWKSKAERIYVKRMLQTVVVYLLLTFAAQWTVHHLHPGKAMVYVLAAVPTLAVVKMLHVVALYIQEESDEYLRRQFVQAILAGLAVTLAVNAFSDFVRGFTGSGGLPPFMLFTICWATTGLTQGVLTYRNRVSDEEPTA